MKTLIHFVLAYPLITVSLSGCSEPAAEIPEPSRESQSSAREMAPSSNATEYSERRRAMIEKMTSKSEETSIENMNRSLDAAEAGGSRRTPHATDLDGIQRRQQRIGINNSFDNINTILDAAD